MANINVNNKDSLISSSNELKTIINVSLNSDISTINSVLSGINDYSNNGFTYNVSSEINKIKINLENVSNNINSFAFKVNDYDRW